MVFIAALALSRPWYYLEAKTNGTHSFSADCMAFSFSQRDCDIFLFPSFEKFTLLGTMKSQFRVPLKSLGIILPVMFEGFEGVNSLKCQPRGRLVRLFGVDFPCGFLNCMTGHTFKSAIYSFCMTVQGEALLSSYIRPTYI